jgi:putative chitinase
MSFEFEFTKEHLGEIISDNPDNWYDALCELLPKYGITTERRVAHFLSQCAHESRGFTALEENLNYSAKALRSVFGRYFGDAPKANADEYARNPEKIANRVYFDKYRKYKMGNVNEGDGWLFRGRSACWFWDAKNLNKIADTDDVKRMTKVINGGSIGLDDRKKRYTNALKVLGMDAEDLAADDDDIQDILDDIGVLRKGSKGDGVKLMQEALGIGADGDFGPGTERALKAWQAANGLTADGIAGPATFDKLFD